ncbi:diaminohydroxyphosphoribosylaminopyrimidine deaminase / 5-amino-6-(5-phosphoribosylamino)uracil reductase [Rubrobacter xylanophilus DSM 9941]|uniref:Riboflavin biosynthesis protein RibD n=1 Tax=Rubrobacter xylanophilus (strain DSM 9941 / JCM 11954 / NBRC 16129 / PRD-1) TaxID=266117 RepID=Q1AWA1_RUBXD|nr:bifunctional diaminohydroxyphosphoribosylaminopyrimidine deaminase/5-amino-6-(5-phosphoribosylamino)uracil reductase RibD [Rubrobacter xylanophilus]ABG04327.1 diaminohydroxyphosphoribosylaminopyrimidine deaminase / 5-amino-6-(5-phosphoribosylamino)uracil reductase [Rubrobacter xylanophilus DSM 9941]
MDLARELAERGRYTAAPNPLVGAVVVRGGAVVGEGWHVRPGEEHAEAMALRRAGAAARGATMYVTLEPCNHHLRTPGPPCAEAVLRAGIRRLVVGHADPNPRVNGRSLRRLREAGVEVEVLDDPVFERQNERFFWAMRRGRPFVHLKLAVTLDGRIAAAGGDSRWVTGPEARRRAHALRAEAGAVLVGAGTARADDPLLTPRGLDEEPPRVLRAVLDPRLTLPEASRLVSTAPEWPLVVFCAEGASPRRRRRLEAAGAEVEAVPAAGDGGLDLGAVLERLRLRGASGVLVEGGGQTARRFVAGGLVNKMTLFYAPRLAGADGVPMVGGLRVTRMAQAPRFSVAGVERLGDDLAVTLYPAEGGGDVHRVG